MFTDFSNLPSILNQINERLGSIELFINNMKHKDLSDDVSQSRLYNIEQEQLRLRSQLSYIEKQFIKAIARTSLPTSTYVFNKLDDALQAPFTYQVDTDHGDCQKYQGTHADLDRELDEYLLSNKTQEASKPAIETVLVNAFKDLISSKQKELQGTLKNIPDEDPAFKFFSNIFSAVSKDLQRKQ